MNDPNLRRIPKPAAGEYAPYAMMYIGLLLDDGLVLQHLKDNLEIVKQRVSSLSEELLTHRFAPGEWTIKEILVHVIDDERIYSYRALRFARNDVFMRAGVASSNRMSVRAIAYHITGHELHHLNSIQENYLPDA